MPNSNQPSRTETHPPRSRTGGRRKTLCALFVLAVALGAAARAHARTPDEHLPCEPGGQSPYIRCHTPGDFDGDRKADIGVFRPGEGSWYHLKSSDASQMVTMVLGTWDDRPVPGDYNGDGIADWAIFRETMLTWWVYQSPDPNAEAGSSYTWVVESLADVDCVNVDGGCRPAPGDYDGDGKTDFAITRLGVFYILPSAGGDMKIITLDKLNDVVLDNHNDINIPADYDGDGLTDPAIYDEVHDPLHPDPENSTWRWVIKRSTDQQVIIIPLGIHRDSPAPGDYNGDGKTDVAVYRPSKGKWYIVEDLDSSNPVPREVHWGAVCGSDVAVAADYDGDRTTDFAVWRPADQYWHINYSTNGQHYSHKFGLPGDIPIPLITNRFD